MSFSDMRTMGPEASCCGPGCTIARDNFSRDTSANWTDEAGSKTISGGALSTSSGIFRSTHNTAGTLDHGVVQVDAKVSASGGKFNVRGSIVDDSNYLFAEVTISGASSTLKLYKRESGSDTQLATTVNFTGATDTYYTIYLCWNGSRAAVILTYTLGLNTGYATDAFTGTGNQAGIGANLSSGTATFDNFLFSKHFVDDPDCPLCGVECPQCEEIAAGAWQLEILDSDPPGGVFVGSTFIIPGYPVGTNAVCQGRLDGGFGNVFIEVLLQTVFGLNRTIVNFENSHGTGFGCSWVGHYSHAAATWDCLEVLEFTISDGTCAAVTDMDIRLTPLPV